MKKMYSKWKLTQWYEDEEEEQQLRGATPPPEPGGFQAPRWASNLQLLHKQDLYCSIIGRLHRHCGAFRCWHQSPSEHQAPSSSSAESQHSSAAPPSLLYFLHFVKSSDRGVACHATGKKEVEGRGLWASWWQDLTGMRNQNRPRCR